MTKNNDFYLLAIESEGKSEHDARAAANIAPFTARRPQ